MEICRARPSIYRQTSYLRLRVKGGRLPSARQPDLNCDRQFFQGTQYQQSAGYKCTPNELGHLYFQDFANTAFDDRVGYTNTGDGLVDDPNNPDDESLFCNLQWNYWTNEEFITPPTFLQ